MDCIELDEELEEAQYATKALERLKVPSVASFQVKMPYAPRNKIEALKRECHDAIHAGRARRQQAKE